jgi:hypothetical protein
LDIDNFKHIFNKINVPKLKPKFTGTQAKIDFDPIKIKVKCSSSNLTKIKLNFKRGNGSNHLMGMNDTYPRLKEELAVIMSYSTNQPKKSRKTINSLNLKPEDIGYSHELKVENTLFQSSAFLNTPRKTAYFGK